MFKKIFQNRLLTLIITIIISVTGLAIYALTQNNTDNNMDNLFIQKQTEENEIEKVVLNVNGLSCSSCIENIKSALKDTKGIKDIIVDIPSNSATIFYNPKKVKNIEIITKRITEIGYPASIKKIFTSEELKKEQVINREREAQFIGSVSTWKVSRSDFDIELNSAKKSYQIRYGEDLFLSNDGASLELNLKAQIASKLFEQALMIQDIRNAKYSVPIQRKKEYLEIYLNKTNTTEEEMKAQLSDIDYPWNYFEKKIIDNGIITDYLENIIYSPGSSESQKDNQFNSWFMNIKSLNQITYYAKELENLLVNNNISSSCCE